jgi:hypothetical protein
VRSEEDATHSGSCPVADCSISGVEPCGLAIRMLVMISQIINAKL